MCFYGGVVGVYVEFLFVVVEEFEDFSGAHIHAFFVFGVVGVGGYGEAKIWVAVLEVNLFVYHCAVARRKFHHHEVAVLVVIIVVAGVARFVVFDFDVFLREVLVVGDCVVHLANFEDVVVVGIVGAGFAEWRGFVDFDEGYFFVPVGDVAAFK